MAGRSIFDSGDVDRDEATGRPRRIRGEFRIPEGDDVADAVKGFLLQNGDELALPGGQTDLKVIQDVNTPTRRVVRFQQTHAGTPVFERTVLVQLDQNNRVRQLDLDHEPSPRVAESKEQRRLTPAQALRTAVQALGEHTTRQKPPRPEQIYYPTDQGLRLAYLVLIPTREPAHDWRIIVDARTGQILEQEDILVTLPDGQGLVFDPNPVVSAMNNTLRDPTATVATCGFAGTPQATIDAQRVNRTLKDLTVASGMFTLNGPYCLITEFGAPSAAPPQEASGTFNYSAADDRFEAVNVYYHVDTIQRYIQSALGITNAHNSQIPCDVHDTSLGGGAFFSSVDGGLHFGDSGTCKADRGEEADAVLHEYGHAMHHDQVPTWGGTNPVTMRRETRAMGEGFGDILACVFFADRFGGFQREVFEDWVFVPAGLRRVDGAKVYPGGWVGAEHADGEIWSAALWNIYRAIGGDSMNPADHEAARVALLKSVILSHFTTMGNASMPDAAEQVLLTNAELPEYLGKHLMQMLDSFHARGILLCDANADLYMRDAAGDLGVDAFVGPVFWDSPDLWVRNADDNGTAHQPPEFGQDNWFYVRVSNRGTANARAFVVTFNVKPWAGVEFTYPNDFIPFVSATVGFNLAPGTSTILKAKWPSAAVPPAGTHACLLASVYMPTDPTPSGLHVWDKNNLAQKNLTIIDLIPGDSILIPFQLGNLVRVEAERFRIEVRRPSAWTTLPLAIVSPDPEVVRELFGSIEEIQERGKPVTAGRASPVLRFLEPTRVEISGAGPLATLPVRLSLGPQSSLDLGRAPADPSAELLPADRGRQADLVRDAGGRPAIAFQPGLLAGVPVVLKPRTPISLGLRVTAPPDAKPGDTIRTDLIQRNAKGQVIGGIAIQINIVARK